MNNMSNVAALCAAIDSFFKACNVRTKEGSKWCSRHDAERKKLYAGYKAHHAALDAFPEHAICRSVKVIKNCSSFETIKAWSSTLHTKYRLLNRCIHARAYFTERFFGSDMDFGHKTFWHYLLKQRTEVEKLLQDVEHRAYQLILEAQNALWVLEQPSDDSSSAEDCTGHQDEPLTQAAPKLSQQLDSEDMMDVEDPIDVALREKREELWEKIWTRLARYCAPRYSRYYQERTEVIYACVRRAIYTDPTLMVLAQGHRSVMDMLKSADLNVVAVEKLWNAIKSLYVHDIRAAVDDVLRPKTESGKYVIVLGARVYRDLSGMILPFHAWGHMAAILCYTCVRRACETVDEVIALTRYAILSGGGLAQSRLKYEFDYDNARPLVLCGFVPNVIEEFGPRYKIEKCNCVFDHNTPHWSETKNNPVLCAGLSLADPKSQLFVNACLRHPDFAVLVRKGPNGIAIRSRHLIAMRTRKANTRAGLKKVDWTPDGDSMYLKDSVLEETYPLVSAADPPITDCFQVVIVDEGDGDMGDFINKLVHVWYRVHEVNDLRGLVGEIGNPYLDNGELEVSTKGKQRHPIVPNLELDVLQSYKCLWGRGPREGRLVDDDVTMELVLSDGRK